VLSLGYTAAVAIAAQPDAGTLLNQEQRSQQRFPGRLPETERQPARPALRDAGGARVVIKSVRFTGAVDLATESELQGIVAKALGQELDFAGLEQLARSVTEFLRGKGWFLSEAYLPKQDVTDGNIEISIRAGRLDGKENKGEPFVIVPGGKLEARIDSARLRAIAAGLLPAGAPADESEIERAILLMNDLPGISARARLEPGIEEGSAHVVIDFEEGPLLSGAVGLDNYGNHDTGVNQANAAVRINDLSGNGDQAGVAATHADGLDYARISYALPVGSAGAKLGANLSSMQYKIMSGSGQSAGLKGSADTAGLTLSYPFRRSRANNLYGTLGYTSKALKDDSAAGLLHDKRVGVWNATLSGDRLDGTYGGGFTFWNVGWTEGRLDLSRLPSDAAYDAAGYDTQGGYGKLSYGLARLQKLLGPLALFANFSGQTAGKNLDSSEKFILGGPNGVRAYPGSEASGDSGWLANVEVRYDLPGTGLGPLQLIAFYDTGSIKLHDDTKDIAIATYSQQNSYRLSGWGLGLNLSKTGSYALRLAWAQKIGDNPGRTTNGLDADGHADRSRAWLQATWWL